MEREEFIYKNSFFEKPNYNKQQAINPKRRAERKHMKELGLKTMKAYRKYIKKQRRLDRDKG